MSPKPTIFLGISSYLHPNASGHYLGVHTLYHEELEKRKITNTYLGAKNGEASIHWIEPKVDFVPTKLLNLDQVLKQIRMGIRVWKHSRPGGLTFVFEGNLNFWLAIAVFSRLKSSFAHINLIRSDLIYEEIILGSNFLTKLYSKICRYVGQDFVSISTLSRELSTKLEIILGNEVTVIPTLSSFRPIINSARLNQPSKKALIFAPYLSDINTLLRIIDKYPEIRSKIIVSSWQSDEVMNQFINYNIQTSNSHLSEAEYEELLSSSSHVVLFYLNSFHKFGSSSKVYDCARLGISICVPMDTAVEEQGIDCANLFSFNGESEESILNAILNPEFDNHLNLDKIPDGKSAVSFLLSNMEKMSRRSSKMRTSFGLLALLGIAIISVPISAIKTIKSAIRWIMKRTQ
jgi:hypothetical protein